MSETVIKLTKYQCIDQEMTFEGVDLSSATFIIREAKPAELAQAQFTVLDAEAGRVRMFLPSTLAATMTLGGSNFFRLDVDLGGGSNIALPKIGIEII